MHPLKMAFNRTMKNLLGKRVSPTSLQFRLTLELILLSILGLGGISLWAGWQMEQTLISVHKQNLKYIGMHFPEQVAMSQGDREIATELKQAIDLYSRPGLLMWVSDPNGEVLARSSGMNIPSPELITVLGEMNTPVQPSMMRLGDRHFITCGSPLSLDGQPLGKVHLLQDITDEQRQLRLGINSLILASMVVVALLIGAIAQRIRKALRPLAHMSQVAEAISADDLSASKLQLHQAPDEILGLAQAFNEMLSRLSMSWEQQRQFVGNVSHELRTPLTVITGYLQSLLRRGENLSTHQQQAVATAAAEAERTIQMLEDLLDLARADSGNLHFRLNPVILNTLVVEVADMSRKVSNRPITVIATEEDVVACADQDRLSQVLINLLDNAIKYSAADQPVDLILERTPQQALIHVRDRGIGIPLPHQQRIFERFYRADDGMTRSRDGTGLGLAIAKSLIEGMEGRITLRSKPGEGSIFTINLPLWRPIP